MTRPMVSQLGKTSPCVPTCPRRSSTCYATCPDWAKWEEYKKPNKTSPCTPTCPDRTSTCHATCPDWAKWEAYKKPIYAARALAVDEYSNFEIGQAVKRRGRRAPLRSDRR